MNQADVPLIHPIFRFRQTQPALSAFLGSQARCTYSDIKRLYNIRSELVHGRRSATAAGENLADAHELEFVVAECMKKMLAESIYLKYKVVADKEFYFNQLTSVS